MSTQVIAVQQLQKPTVVANLVGKFGNNSSAAQSCVVDHTLMLYASTRQRPFDVGSRIRPGAGGRLFLDPVGMTLTKADEVAVANAGDDTISVVDLNGRCQRRIDQSEFLSHSHGGATVDEASQKRDLPGFVK